MEKKEIHLVKKVSKELGEKIGTREGKFVFYFKNIKLFTAEPPNRLFKRCVYDRNELKDAPICSTIKDKIMGMVRKM